MKKLLTLIGIAAVSLAYSQGIFIINNYSGYDFHGSLSANNFAGGCYPYVHALNPATIIAPAYSNMGNSNAIIYKNYRDQYTDSLFPITQWSVTTSPTNTQPRAWNHAAVMPGGTVANNTTWSATKFQMYFAGTNTPETFFNGNVGNNANPCVLIDNLITTPYGTAEWFTITTGTTVTTFLEIH
ncbi:hypothetical protein [Chryseobacterium sp. SIMBA_029]|uniref:hypothetical protein n=1 Tax=Chryseobacterium sp. SIMBA_029 TaxID=3085772 RepID=UPI00397A5767